LEVLQMKIYGYSCHPPTCDVDTLLFELFDVH